MVEGKAHLAEELGQNMDSPVCRCLRRTLEPHELFKVVDSIHLRRSCIAIVVHIEPQKHIDVAYGEAVLGPQTRMSCIGQFRQRLGQRCELRGRYMERTHIGLRHEAVVQGVFLAAQKVSFARGLVKSARRWLDRTTL